MSLDLYRKLMDELGLFEVEFYNWGEPLSTNRSSR
jgi:hypothetical protein